MSKSKSKKGNSLLPLTGTGGAGLGFKGLPDEVKQEEKKGKFKRSGHLTDQILKYNYPPDESGQLSLWETLEDGTK